MQPPNFEFDHQENVKIAAKRTRQHESTWIGEIEGAVDFMGAVKATVAPERQTFKGGLIPAAITAGVCDDLPRLALISPSEGFMFPGQAHPRTAPGVLAWHSISTNTHSDHCWGSGWYPTVDRTSDHWLWPLLEAAQHSQQ